jgi:PPOX class probable F420-dependent enzyme
MWTNKEHSYDRYMTEKILWFTSVSAEGVPSTAPVWYHIESDTTLLVYSKDPSVRATNLAANDRVTLALPTDEWAGDVVVMNGRATIDPTASPADSNGPFIKKYQVRLDRYGWTPKWYAENYPTIIRIEILSIRGR